MPIPGETAPQSLEWLLEMGLSREELRALYPCVPGESTMSYGLYVNTATPRVVYRGSHEGTLPMVAGRWYMIPSEAADRHSALRRDNPPVARAVRLIR